MLLVLNNRSQFFDIMETQFYTSYQGSAVWQRSNTGVYQGNSEISKLKISGSFSCLSRNMREFVSFGEAIAQHSLRQLKNIMNEIKEMNRR